MVKNKNKPDLCFSPSRTLEGFTSSGVQGFNELNPAAIVRELIQNSLDAVREDERTEAIIRFELENIKLADVPAIGDYRAAFKSAVRDQKRLLKGELPDQAEMVVDAIQSCLATESIDVLSVLDNGLGLNKERMVGLLADGVSVKPSTGAGAVGNGHLTAIPTSDLRYVLYGGVSDEGKIASGHAILASFSNSQGASVGKDGYYVLAVNDSFDNPYDFAVGKNIAPLIKRKLDWIEVNFNSKSGAVVVIPGFNKFREPKIGLWDAIKKAAACSFFTAIADGHLKVIYVDGSGEIELSKSSIGSFFDGNLVAEKRAKSFLSGNRAAEAYKTAIEGQTHHVDVGCGRVEVMIREVLGGSSRIDLCRNGMWISNKLPLLQANKFSDRRPFHCLIKVTAQNGEIHRLIRKSEGPLHNHIEARKWLKPKESRQLREAFGKISEFLLSHLEKLQAEEFQVNDFLSVIGGKEGKFEEVPPRPPKTPSSGSGVSPGPGPRPGPGPGPDPQPDDSRPFRKGGNAVLLGGTLVPTGARSCEMELFPQEELGDALEAELRFVLDESIDETCDIANDEQFVKLKAVKLNNKEIPESHLVKSKDADAILGVRLGQFTKSEKNEQKYRLSFEYDLPDGVSVGVEDKVVLQAEIVRRRARA